MSESLTVRDGKDMLEFSVRAPTKGDGIEHLREYTAATAVLYAGDDVTDEDAFACCASSRRRRHQERATGETAARSSASPTAAGRRRPCSTLLRRRARPRQHSRASALPTAVAHASEAACATVLDV